MISKELLEKILEQLDPFDTVPDNEGNHTVSWTTYGCSSLSRGGTYYDKANNQRLSEMFEGRQGVRKYDGWPGVHSIDFNPSLMDEETGELLLAALEDMHIGNPGYPCLDEDLANRLEMDDIIEAVAEALDDAASHDETGMFPEGYEADEKDARLMLEIIDRMGDGCVVEPQPGPYVYVDEDRFAKLIPEFVKKRF